MQIVCGLLSYDKIPEKEVDAPFTWESIKLRVRRCAEIRINDEIRTIWQRVLANDETKKILQQTLMEASILMPPLYVGRTNNLKRRYLQHTGGDRLSKNNFHFRFMEYAEELEIKISVSDLLFVCIETQKDLDRIFLDMKENEFNVLIEQILMQFCRPPFSMR